MNNIELGVVRSRDSGVWVIVDSAKVVLVRFSRATFQYPDAGSRAYFVRNPADATAAINVQPVMLVDGRVDAAGSTNGYNESAEFRLRSYIMDRLLVATGLSGPARTAIFRDLDTMMESIRAAAEATRLKKVTLVLLTSLGIP